MERCLQRNVEAVLTGTDSIPIDEIDVRLEELQKELLKVANAKGNYDSIVIENGTTQAQLAETIETTGQYVNRIIKKQDGVVNKTFVQILETLGYNIELTYVKRN